MTNGDKIRAMDDQELAEWVGCPYRLERIMCKKEISCRDCSLKWVKQKAEETDGK
jgi:hypothetical protein